MYKKAKGRFGEWVTDAVDIADGLVCKNDGGIYHIVDVYTTEEEWESVRHKGEPCGWTYVADDEGLSELKEQFFIAQEFDAYGYEKEEVES